MVIIVAWIVTLLYVFYLIVQLIYWNSIKQYAASEKADLLFFSVIIPVRNEVENIYQLLQDLNAQDYDSNKFEVVIVDDFSEDGTNVQVKRAMQDLDISIRLISVGEEVDKLGKKHAITKGVEAAKYDHIICTDGDCRVGINWLEQYRITYLESKALMILGPVVFNDSTKFFQKMQKTEFLALIGLGASSLQMGMPTICNGANISYRKELFFEVNGYEGNHQIPSGDDEFLLQKAFDRHPSKIVFNKSISAVSSTKAKDTVSGFLNQRIRWSAKWKYHKTWRMKLWGISMFLFNLALIVFTTSLLTRGLEELFMATMVLRLIVEYAFIYQIGSDLGEDRKLHVSTLVLQLIYPFYVILLMISSFLRRYSWKGRFYL